MTDVPNFQKLVFAVRSQVDAISFTSDVRDSLCVANKDASRAIAVQGSSIPDFDHAIVTTREDDVGVLPVRKTDRVDLI